jgi:two-component system response regulator (stage 0 sporulation protein F)
MLLQLKIVLIVDDEPLICALLTEILSECNLHILTAHDGLEAIRTLQTSKEPVTLAIIDYSMPGMDCEELIKELRRINNRLRFIISSGVPGRLFNDPESLGIVAMMPKPYSMQAMVTLVLSQIDAIETSA